MSAILTSSIWNQMNPTEECKPTTGPKLLYSIVALAIAAHEWEDAFFFFFSLRTEFFCSQRII